MKPDRKSPTSTYLVLLAVASVALAVAHVPYTWAVGYALFESRGGVQEQPNGWTHFGGIDFAWTAPVHVPGCGLLAMSPTEGRWPVLGPIAMLALLAGSLLAGWSLASVLAAGILRRRAPLGRHAYRVWLAIVGWGWILVPVRWSWVYWWTVHY